MNTKSKTRLIFLITAFMGILSATMVNAQSSPAPARAGIKVGMNVSNLYIDDNVNDENARIGFNGGVYGQFLSTETFAIQPELLYSTKGTQAHYQGLLVDRTVRFNLNYVDVPVLAVFKLGPSAEIHAGGYGSFLLNANITYQNDNNNGSGTDELDRDHFKSYDYGLVGGFGLNFGVAQIGVRYNYGLVRIADSSSARNMIGNSKNSVGQLYLALDLNKD